MIAIADYGFTENDEDAEGLPARVTAVHRERYELACEYGECFGRLKAGVYYSYGNEEYPTTGDFVRIIYNPLGDSQIIKTLARRSFFSRREPGPIPRDQAIAANFDYVFIVQSMNQNFNTKRLERYLTLAWQSGAEPVVVLTKADLADAISEYVRASERLAPGVGVHPVSSVTGDGLDALEKYLAPRRTIVLLGSSGVGKSSLLNAVAGTALMEVGEIREDDARGRHTTTHRQLLMLPCGAMVIDTPGMRELGMWDVSEGLHDAFSDVEEYLGKCRFSDCGHQTEPGCAVRTAIERGELPQERWDSYLKLKREARFTDNKAEYARMREQRGREISKYLRQQKESGGKWNR